MVSASVSSLLVLISYASAATLQLVWEHDENVSTHLRASGHRIDLTLHLSLKDPKGLEALFWSISDPKHNQYQRFLSKEEIDSKFGAKQESLEIVGNWLESLKQDFPEVSFRQFSDGFRVSALVPSVESIFETNVLFLRGKCHESLVDSHHVVCEQIEKHDGFKAIRHGRPLFIPKAVSKHIDLISGFTEPLPQAFKQISKLFGKPLERPLDSTEIDLSEFLTPQDIRTLYHVHPSSNAKKIPGSVGIVAFEENYQDSDVRLFVEYFNLTDEISLPSDVILPRDRIRRRGEYSDVSLLSKNTKESNLDVQSVLGMTASTNVSIVHFRLEGNNWILDMTQQIFDNFTTDPVDVLSISYGYPEELQCSHDAPGRKFCVSSDYWRTYIERTNVYFQKLGLLGISVIAASGDSGAPGENGNCPWETSSDSQCREALFQYSTLISDGTTRPCAYPVEFYECSFTYFSSDCLEAAKLFQQQISKRWPEGRFNISPLEMNVPAPCAELPVITFGNCSIRGYEYKAENGNAFWPEFPSSSPYVTSVGASQLLISKQDLSQESSFEEITASREFGSRITSGGGFSKLHSRPKYQEESVESYFARGNDPLLPPGFQDPGTRAYPDVMMIGHAVGIIDQAKPYPSDGTSAGAPILSGLVALWNVELKSQGKSQLGFLNPLLYHLQEKNPQVFVDIISGNNRCGLIDGPYDIPNCCKYGFSAGQGFDPVSGLGRPLWSEILKEILNMTTKSPE